MPLNPELGTETCILELGKSWSAAPLHLKVRWFEALRIRCLPLKPKTKVAALILANGPQWGSAESPVPYHKNFFTLPQTIFESTALLKR